MIHDTGIVFDKTIKGNDLRLFNWLCGKMLPGGWLEVTQAYMAEQFGLKPANVSVSIKRLIAGGYMEELVKQGTGRKFLRICDAHASKGSYAHRQALKAKREDEFAPNTEEQEPTA